MNAPLTIVVPMAGRGSRFANVGVTTPKPLIDVRGKPMYAWAVDSLPLALATRLVFVVLEEHLAAHDLRRDIETRYARYEPRIVALKDTTRGQAETVLRAADAIELDGALLIYNADTFERNRLADVLPRLPARVAGLWTVFRAPGDKWSFARLQPDGDEGPAADPVRALESANGDGTLRVVETAEKRRISDFASTGLYWWRSARDFVRLAKNAIERDERAAGEFYVAPLFNALIAEGAEVRASIADEVWALGTPEDLARFGTEYRGAVA